MRNQAERKRKYEYLREHGKFSSRDANMYKDRKWSNIKELCQMNLAFIEQRDNAFKNQTKKGE